MDFITNAMQQLRQLWTASSTTQRAFFVTLIVAAGVTIGAVGWWSSQPQFIPLAANLAPDQAAEIISKLDSAGIRTDMNFAGTTVLVPKQDFGRARAAAGSLAVDAPQDLGSYTDSIFRTPSETRLRVQQVKARQLEMSLQRMKAVETADVHIAQPEYTPFARERADVTASVVLGLRPSVAFSPQQAATVVATVAGSIEGLEKENVTVTDLNGRILAGKGMHQGVFSSQMEHQRRVEQDLADRAEDLLTRMLGPGKAAVRVTAKIDFTQTQRVETTYDPDGEVKQKEVIESTTTTKAESGSSGVSGAQGNLGVPSQKAPITESRESSDVEYSHAKTTDTIMIAGGNILRLTVAAMVDLNLSDAETRPVAGALDPAKVESVIRQAVGFDETRGDEIEVLYTPLATAADPGPPLIETIDTWEFYTEIARHASLGVAAVVALALGFLILKKMRPLTVTAETDRGIGANQTKLMAELAARARDNPEVVSRIVEAWMEVPDPDRRVPPPHISTKQTTPSSTL